MKIEEIPFIHSTYFLASKHSFLNIMGFFEVCARFFKDLLYIYICNNDIGSQSSSEHFVTQGNISSQIKFEVLFNIVLSVTKDVLFRRILAEYLYLNQYIYEIEKKIYI